MVIIVNENYGVSLPQGNTLGFVGENELRTHRVIWPALDGRVGILRLKYAGGTVSDIMLDDGAFTVDSSMLTAAGEVQAQLLCVVPVTSGDPKQLDSDIFTLVIKPSLSAG